MVRAFNEDIYKLKDLKYDFRVDNIAMVIHELIKGHKATEKNKG